MLRARHEKYADLINEFPFSLAIDLERTPYNCSKEQNWHENLEIQLCTHGSGIVLLDGEKYIIKKGDIIIVNSNVVHYTYTDCCLKYTCLIISTQWCKQMNINYSTLNFSPCIKSPTIEGLIAKLTCIYSNSTDNLRTAKLNKVLLHILIELTEHHSKIKLISDLKNKKFEIIKATTDFIEKNFNKKITLDEISKVVFFDKYALCKEFKKYTGQTVINYLHQYRCIKAIDYLKEGFTVSETASLCGFENLSFFTKIFKRYTGNNPSHYKS